MSISPKARVLDLPKSYHGSIDFAEMEALGLDPARIIDFSASCNPLGPSPLALAALRTVSVERYPDRQGTRLRQELAGLHDVSPGHIALGNGSVELIWSVAQAFLESGDTVLIVGPTFGEYEMAGHIAGATVLEFRAAESEDFALDIDRVVAVSREARPKLIFVCNPNNPTGLYLERSAIERLLSACSDSLLVVDEAYLGFVQGADSLVDLIDKSNLVLLRSLTKDYALAGLRAGYALANPLVAGALEAVRPPWSVNAFALAAAQASLGDAEHLARSRAEVFRAGRVLVEGLQELGLRTIPSRANFLLVDVGGAPDFRARLLREGFCVRDCTSFGLPSFIRIAVRTVAECQALLSAMRKVVER